jgi:tight adherence protein C
VTAIGAALAAVSVTALLVALRPTSTVARRLELIAPAHRRRIPGWVAVPEIQLRHAGFVGDPGLFVTLKVASALACAVSAALATLLVPLGPAMPAVAAYVGFIAPTLVVDRRASARRADAEREVTVLVERLEALAAAGRPPETALAALVQRPTGAEILDGALRRTADAYALGAPLFRTLASAAREDGLVCLAAVADDLERARDLGAGSIGVIRERRGSLRAAERARTLEAAAQVEGKLMLILVLCYLPALVLLVIAPLFLGLLEGLLA